MIAVRQSLKGEAACEMTALLGKATASKKATGGRHTYIPGAAMPAWKRTLWTAAMSLLIAGCSTGLPTVDASRFGQTTMSASPTCNWYGSGIDLKTYWGEQEVSVYASVHLPDNWQQPGDGTWCVKARNAEGKPIPFLGVLRRYRDNAGAESTMIVPRADEKKLQDCLYLVIDPNITTEGGKIKSVRPVAILCEIRNRSWKPFRIELPLIPAEQSDLTPMPEQGATLLHQ